VQLRPANNQLFDIFLGLNPVKFAQTRAKIDGFIISPWLFKVDDVIKWLD
jgi:hypothetical protein